MSPRDDRVPLLLRLSIRLLPADVREEVLGDLLELWRAEVRHRPWARRVLWVFRQPLAAAISRLRFGGRGRKGIGLASSGRLGTGISWLDVKLGVRMVAKYPGLSLISVLGMAVAIAIGAGVFGVIAAMRDPTLPLPGGGRIVAVENNRADNPGNPDRQFLHDLVEWRSELTTVRDLGAFRTISRNLIIESRGTDLVEIAQMSAAGFRVARIPPLLGRPLLEDDERAGAPPVLVIGYDEWQRRFDADPDIIGRTVRLGETVHTVVGVMPDGFRFPVNHGFWVPLRLDVAKYAQGDGPSMEVFGRLADGAMLEQARAQLAAIGDRMAAAYPDTHEHLRPTIIPYAYTRFDVNSPGIAWQVYTAQLVVSLLLVLVAANVAVLVYARTATRTGEIAVRTALGASRARVVGQLFVEALVLSLGAAAYGLVLAGVALGWVERLMQDIGGLPFWFDLGLSGGLIAYVAGLAILGGAIVGVLPALKATGRKAYGGLQQLAARGSQMRLGRTWTALIVVQVGFAVAVLPTAIHSASGVVRIGMDDPDYPAEEFFGASLSLERKEAPPSAEADAYQRLDGEEATSIGIIVRTRGGPPPMFTRRLRDIVASVDPGFQLHGLRNFAEDRRAELRTYRTAAVGVAVAMLSVLLLSAAGIYAMLSFTVARRRREIGIRTALGADRRRILGGIFARAAAQLGVGVAAGLMLALALQWATHGALMGYHSAGYALHDTFVLMPFVAAIVMVVGLLAALGPARRGLAVQPTEALREE